MFLTKRIVLKLANHFSSIVTIFLYIIQLSLESDICVMLVTSCLIYILDGIILEIDKIWINFKDIRNIRD